MNNNNSKSKRFLRRKTQSETWSHTQAPSSSVGADSNSIHETPETVRYNKPIQWSEDTAADTRPSQSTFKDIRRVITLIEEERHLVAYELYSLHVKRRIDEYLKKQCEATTGGVVESSERMSKNWSGWKKLRIKHESTASDTRDAVEVEENEEAYRFYLERVKEFEALEKRATMFQTAQQNLNTATSWTLSQTLFGITTHYRRESDNTLSIKIEGELHGIPLFEQMVVLRECDLYHTWAPFCTESKKLAQLDKLDVVAWYNVGTPLLGLVRDACYRAVGCDCMREDGSVLIVAVGLGDNNEGSLESDFDCAEKLQQQQREEELQQVEETKQREQLDQENAETSTPILNNNAISFLARDELLSTIELPPIPTGMGHGRMTIRNFSASVKILGTSSARTRMVVNIDPNLHFVPQSFIDFCMKRVCGVLLARLQVAARKVLKDPVKNPHARRMREDVRFYRDWLLPKFRTYCDELGWTMPPVKAFEVTEDELSGEDIFEGWRSEDMLDNSTTKSSTQSDVKDARAAMQQYQIVDNVSPRGDLCHRRSQSENAGFISPPRTRKRDRLNHFARDGFSRTDDDSTPSCEYSETSTQRKIRRRDKLKQLFGEKETREEKIAASREVAAARLRPEPFSESKVLRLKELKEAKARTEERLLRRSAGRGSLSGSEFGSNRSDFQTSSFQSESFLLNKSDESSTLKRHAIILVVSLLFNLALIPFQPYALTALELPPFFKMSTSDWADLMARNALAIFMIVLHATSLWAILNTFLVIAFDAMDFGQQHLAKNLDYGKKLYVDGITKYSKLVSVGIVALSFSVGLVSALFQNIIFKMCLRLEKGFTIHFLSIAERVPASYSGVLDTISRWIDLAKGSCVLVIGWIRWFAYQMRIPSFFKYTCVVVSWIAAKASSLIPSLLKRIGDVALTFLFRSLPSTIMSQLSICKDRSPTILSWRSEAVQISSFITTRLAVFVLALLVMSYLVLPKPEKKLNKSDHTKVRGAPMREVELRGVAVSVDAPTPRRQHLSTRSSGSIPMEVIHE